MENVTHTYSDMVIAHFLSPQNVGEIEDAGGVGCVGDPDCGDSMKLFIKVKDFVIIEISYVVYGCPAAIATGSVTTEMAKGKTIREAMNISEKDIINALEGLPPAKKHCSNMGAAALKEAVKDYLNKINDTGTPYSVKYKK